MNELEVMFSAYLAVLAGGGTTELAKKRAYIALDDYKRWEKDIELYKAMPDAT